MNAAIYLSGKIADNHEISETKKGALWLKLFLELESVRPDGHGNVKTESTVVPISFFSREAQVVKDLRPGERLVIGCRLAGTSFNAPDGTTRRGVQLTADSVHFPAKDDRTLNH